MATWVKTLFKFILVFGKKCSWRENPIRSGGSIADDISSALSPLKMVFFLDETLFTGKLWNK